MARLTTQLQRKQQRTEKPMASFTCTMPGCGRAFNRKYTLSEHIKTHTGEKPHVCPIKSCGKRFTTVGNLSRHKRLHGPVLPLECPVAGCPCTFSSDLKLEKHMKFHFSTSAHLCDVVGCGKTFSTVGNLNRHLRNQHDIHEQLQIAATPLSRSPKMSSAQSPTGADDLDFGFANCEVSDEDDDMAWLTTCIATTEPLTLKESTQPWTPESLNALSLMFDAEDQ
uniref:C2H2-type domain-containing protein n=1 Tax=Globisporangium ultimum (strain ATCC 200006 / CBS 805.95 / DAOM BR144) TaxID=431595 RepID=K3WUW8_GLOUD